MTDALQASDVAIGILQTTDPPLAAPCLIDLEVTSACRRLVLEGKLTENDAAEWLRHLGQLPLERHPHVELIPRIWELRHQLTPYDACYVALAERLGAPLLTADRRLAQSHGLRCEVRLVR